ncbi:PAS domain S-box protein [Lacinutrix sp. C3R15]|uniref:sensor histidine kinase n=1 Tax=Flavobacteriaceae TaxID=49546 RepID=UPI001C09C9B5|nr:MULTISPECIES: ATP-binding protein [Flavobacteriaceae]MBU2939166.1 PAS domain S-box protein [Lacinutrix sp. C3R15]MDO6622482.1 ATP-binding protein [Oceanihabitans sp. 1_MG-2023]
MKQSAFYPLLKKPFVSGLATLIILLVITQFIAYQKYLINENEDKKELNNQVALIKEKLQTLVMYSYSATKTLAYIVERNGVPEDFNNIAMELLERNKYFDVVELVDANGFITHVYPLKDNDVIGFNIIKSIEAASGALATIKRKDFFIAGPVHLKQGGIGMVSRQPIFIDNKFSGFSAVVTTLSTFLKDLNIDNKEDNRFIYQLSRVNFNTGKEEFFLEKDMSSYQSYAVPIKMSSGEWKLYVVPSKKPLNTAIGYMVFGFIISFLGGWSVWYLKGQSQRFKKLVNSKLVEQEKQLKQIYESSKEKIEKSEILYRSLTSNAPVAIFNTNEAGAFTYVNEQWVKYSGMSLQKSLGSAWQKAIHPEDKERVLNEWQNTIMNDTEFKSELRFQDKNGKITWLQVKAVKLIDTNNKKYGFIGIASDITERINNEKELLGYKNNLEKLVNLRTEELHDSKEALLNLLEDMNIQSMELEKEKVKAQSADLMKSAFLATMSHELRTPMNSIIGFTGILLKELAGPLNDEQKKQLTMVKNSGEHLLRLINDVLDISKIEAGKLKVSFYPFDYLLSLKNTLDFLKPQASAKGLGFKTEISEMKITLVSDERRVEQILLNLLSNAIKFSKKGDILVKVAIQDNVLITQVIDQGIGISKKNLVKLFMPFIQLEAGLSRNHEGTGLGLAICKNLIDKLGGTIEVESELGKGSNFTFKLPLDYTLDN